MTNKYNIYSITHMQIIIQTPVLPFNPIRTGGGGGVSPPPPPPQKSEKKHPKNNITQKKKIKKKTKHTQT